jgi:alkylation response protein AidB-like acyl-CoA dehydrogenase
MTSTVRTRAPLARSRHRSVDAVVVVCTAGLAAVHRALRQPEQKARYLPLARGETLALRPTSPGRKRRAEPRVASCLNADGWLI